MKGGLCDKVGSVRAIMYLKPPQSQILPLVSMAAVCCRAWVIPVLLTVDHVLVAVLNTVVWLTSDWFKGVLIPPLTRNETPSLRGTMTSKPEGVVVKSPL